MPRKKRNCERGGLKNFREWRRQAIEQQLQRDRLEREPYWSTAVAVGDREWLAGYVTERNLKRHRIIEGDNACYLKGTGGDKFKSVKSTNAS